MSAPESTSSLRDVFGSQVSLAELSGDIPDGSRSPPSGYTRFGLRSKPPAHSMHTRASHSERFRPVTKRPVNYVNAVLKVFVIMILGLLHARLILFQLPEQPVSSTDPRYWGLQAFIFGLCAIILPWTDKIFKVEEVKKDWEPIVRGYGMFLGLMYAAEKLQGDAALFWVLASPCLWYVVDRTWNGLIAGLFITAATVVLVLIVVPGLSHYSSGHEQLLAIGTFATVIFGSSVIAGNIGRRVLP